MAAKIKSGDLVKVIRGKVTGDMSLYNMTTGNTEKLGRLYTLKGKKNEEVKRERVANATSESVGGDGTVKKQPRKVKKIGRNEPCPCGSGKKYKNCCGRNA